MEAIFPPDSDLDLSFTSCESDQTAISSARTSISCSEIRPPAGMRRARCRNDPFWSAIQTVRLQDGGLGLGHLKLVKHVGSGDIGKVFLCRLKGFDRANFALKVIDRDALACRNKNKLSHVQMEAHVLSIFDHPFLPTLYSHFDVSHYTCFLMDYCPGGDLHSRLLKRPGNRFPASSVRFYAGEVLLALEYLHSLGVVYRDLKPENVLLREDGHVMLSDFDLCFTSDVVPTLERQAVEVGPSKTRGCWWKAVFRQPETVELLPEFTAEPTEARSHAFVGTHEYLAPEIISGEGHGNGVDWWAFGVFIYELLYGRTPFKGRNKESTLVNILQQPLKFPESGSREMCNDVAEMTAAKDLISRLLVKDHRRRLGSTRGATDIKKHPFFMGIKWPLIRSYAPPAVRGSGRPARQMAGISEATAGVRWWSLKGLDCLGKSGNKVC